jgi:hypothetical protein
VARECIRHFEHFGRAIRPPATPPHVVGISWEQRRQPRQLQKIRDARIVVLPTTEEVNVDLRGVRSEAALGIDQRRRGVVENGEAVPRYQAPRGVTASGATELQTAVRLCTGDRLLAKLCPCRRLTAESGLRVLPWNGCQSRVFFWPIGEWSLNSSTNMWVNL